jgi:predicted DNA-binding protein with PD1-like motif
MAAQPMRRILHPGPVADLRADVVDATVRPLLLQLEAGRSLLAAVTEALAATGAASAVLQLLPGSLQPFAYVMPDLSKTPDHAVYFSDRHDAIGPVHLETATVTVGQRDGQTSLHCHARWVDADGIRHCGHVLPHEAWLASTMPASAWLLDGAAFETTADDETAFSLFKPVARPANGRGDAGRPALAVRLAPNEDVCTALESLCRERGIRQATVRGGVGSTVGALFDDGRRVEPFVTELLVRQGRVRPGADGQPQAEIDISLVDHTGGLADGRLARGGNAVLVTFELVIEPD